MAGELSTLAMQRFACIGGACEDTCCRDFGIAIDPGTIQRMRSLAVDAEEARRLDELLIAGTAQADAGPQQILRLREDGACPMLDPDGACGFHRRHGEGALGTACSVFPRSSLAVDGRIEVTGSLACPELARLTLLAPDGPEQRPSPAPVLPRRYVGKAIVADDGYAEPFVRVREALLRLFLREEFPVGSRLAFAAHLAATLDGFFHRGAAASPERLDVELSASTREELLAGIHRDLQSFGGSDGTVIAAVLSMLVERRRLPHPPRFAALLDGAYQPAPHHNPVAGLLAEYLRRRDLVEQRAPSVTDPILSRYCRHFVLRHPYTDAPSLLSYLGRLALSLSTIRFLWCGHPAVQARLEAPPDSATDTSTLADAGVEVIQIFTKAVTHHVAFLEALHRPDEESRAVTFGRLLLFAKVL